MLTEDVPLMLKNWLELNYWKRVRLSGLGPEEITEIPRYYLPSDYQFDLPKKRATFIKIRKARLTERASNLMENLHYPSNSINLLAGSHL